MTSQQQDAEMPRMRQKVCKASMRADKLKSKHAHSDSVPWGWSWYVSCSVSWVSLQRGWRAVSSGPAGWTEQHASLTVSCCCPLPQQKTPQRSHGLGSFSCVGVRSLSKPVVVEDTGYTACKWKSCADETSSYVCFLPDLLHGQTSTKERKKTK